jgi:16S rRNA (guanine1207-N2)-methyltransferase
MSLDSSDDPALVTLLLPFVSKQLAWPSTALFLRARAHPLLRSSDFPGLICEQSFKPDADVLERAGFVMGNDTENVFPLVLVLPPRQRDEARALFARALRQTQIGGRVIAAVSNNEGAKSAQADLEQLVGSVQVLTKNKCRVFWSDPHSGTVSSLAKEWLTLDAPRPICNGRFVSQPGIFAWDRIDAASALLAHHLSNDLRGHAADLGSGLGYLSAELLTRCPGIQSVDLYEAEQRALNLSRHNMQRYESKTPVQYLWHDVTAGLKKKYDVIVTNPPFHTQSHNDRPDIGRRFIAVASEALAPGGRLWLVANRHLPYEATLNASFGTVRTVATEHGFKIVEAVKGSHRPIKVNRDVLR